MQRSLSEPKRFRTNASVALGVLANDVRLFYVTLALEALFWHTRPNHPLPSLRPLIDDLETAVQALARALHSETPVGRWPDLRADHRALMEWLEASGKDARASGSPDWEDRVRLTFVVSEAERLIESLYTIYRLLAKDRERASEPMS